MSIQERTFQRALRFECIAPFDGPVVPEVYIR